MDNKNLSRRYRRQLIIGRVKRIGPTLATWGMSIGALVFGYTLVFTIYVFAQ